MSGRQLDPDSRTSRGRQDRAFRRGLVSGERGFPPAPAPVLSDDFGAATNDSPAGSSYGLTTAVSPARLTSLEAALEIGDYWRLKCVSLMEENLQLKRQVVEAVAETLRVQVVVKEEGES